MGTLQTGWCLLKIAILGAVVLPMVSACSHVEFSSAERHYTVDELGLTNNPMQLQRLTKVKPRPMHWGTLHFVRDDPEKSDISIDFGKEKYVNRPSRYIARTRLPEVEGKATNFILAVDSKRHGMVGIEFKLKKNLWSPKRMFKAER